MPESKRFVKGDQDIEIKGDEFKIFIRPDRIVTQSYVKGLLEYLRNNNTIILPSMVSVIVVYKNGEVKTL